MSIPRLLAAVALEIVASFREGLPADERDAAMFISGMAWMFAVVMVLLVVVTIGWAKLHGVRL